MQRHGTVNADGFGVGWYADGDPVPARYRRAVPIWGDPSLPDLARVTRSGAVLAAVRSAPPRAPRWASQAVAPFGSGRWLFSHNGRARRMAGSWPRSAPVPFGQMDSPRSVAWRRWSTPPSCGRSCSGGCGPERPWTPRSPGRSPSVEAAGGSGRFNFLLTDGRSIAATAAGDTLWYRRGGGAVTVASEPDDDEPGWTEVPGRHVLTAMPSEVAVRPLSSLTEGIVIR